VLQNRSSGQNDKGRRKWRAQATQTKKGMEKQNSGGVGKSADKPGSVAQPCGYGAVIPLVLALLQGSSSLPGCDASHAITPLFGLAPDGVYRASPVASPAVSSYLAVSPLPDRMRLHRTNAWLAPRPDPIQLSEDRSSRKTLRPCGREVPSAIGGLFSVALSVALGRSICTAQLIAPGR
jgi:hypothetical protein